MTGNTKAWIGKFGEIGHPYIHPYAKQCGYYVDLSPYALKSTFPIGMIVMWYGTAVPNGWAICDGSNGTPDLRDRFIVGAGSTYSQGDTGGSNTVKLDLDTMPSHTHPVTGGGSAKVTERGSASADGGAFNWSAVKNISTSSDGISIGNVGGGEAHENRPPYYALYFIMKIS